MMIKYFLGICLALCMLAAYGDLLDSNYVSPETYTVNEADLDYYRYVAPSPKLNVDMLDDAKIQNNSSQEIKVTEKKVKEPKKKKEKTEKPYEQRLMYKVAKWWVDMRYKREEEHHGGKHEIKVQKRIDYENSLNEAEKI